MRSLSLFYVSFGSHAGERIMTYELVLENAYEEATVTQRREKFWI